MTSLYLRPKRWTSIKVPLVFLTLLFIVVRLQTSRHLPDTREHTYDTYRHTPVVYDRAIDTCPNQTRFLERLMRMTVLASYSGSGNTWLRYLIERITERLNRYQTSVKWYLMKYLSICGRHDYLQFIQNKIQETGFATGSNWSDKQLLNKGFIGEFVTNESTIVVKTHDDYDPKSTNPVHSTKRVILLLRNPYDTFLAEFNRHYMGGNHVKNAYISAFIEHWNNFFSVNSKKWQPFYSNWLRCENVLPVLYDDLKFDLKTQLQRVLDFLDDGILKGNVDCALKNNEGHFHRDRSFQPHTNFFYDYKEVGYLNSAIETMQRDLDRRFPSLRLNITSWKIKFGS